MFNFAEWFLSGALIATPMAANTAQVVPASPVADAPAPFNSTEALLEANRALNAISTAKGRFIQIDPAGDISQGSFYLSRPGRMRFEYDDPTPITLVSDGTTVAIEDRDLETVDRVPLSATPLNLILRKNADLAAHANILKVEKRAGLVSVLMSDKSGEAEGQLELFFDPVDYQLRKWETLDMSGQRTTVDLVSIEQGVKLSPALFRVEDPEDEDDRRR